MRRDRTRRPPHGPGTDPRPERNDTRTARNGTSEQYPNTAPPGVLAPPCKPSPFNARFSPSIQRRTARRRGKSRDDPTDPSRRHVRRLRHPALAALAPELPQAVRPPRGRGHAVPADPPPPLGRGLRRPRPTHQRRVPLHRHPAARRGGAAGGGEAKAILIEPEARNTAPAVLA